jgi:K+-transporting ATPase KdpF subunit
MFLIRRAVAHHARHLVSAHHPRGVCRPGACGAGGGKALIIFELTALALGIAAVVYLLIALLKPERF